MKDDSSIFNTQHTKYTKCNINAKCNMGKITNQVMVQYVVSEQYISYQLVLQYVSVIAKKEPEQNIQATEF